MSAQSGSISREFDMKLRMIAEDLCKGGKCDVSLYDQRNEVWPKGDAGIVALNGHVQAINPKLRVEAIDHAYARGLFNRGVPFKVVNSETNEETWLQLSGGSNGVTPCTRATAEEVEESLASARESERHHEQRKAGKQQYQDFIDTLIGKLHARAAASTLTADQRKDYEYHTRSFPAGKPVSDYVRESSSTLPDIANACQLLGITFPQLIAS